MSEPCVHEQVYDVVQESLPPYVPQGPWSMLGRQRDLRSSVSDPAAVLDRLQKRFSVDDLLGTGVAVSGDDGTLALASSLGAGQEAILVLRGPDARVPFDFMSDEGCLSQRLLPICGLLAEPRLRSDCTTGRRPLCVAFSMADAALLLRAGFPCAVASGLRQARGPDLELFRRSFQLSSRDERPANGNFLLTQELAAPGWLLADVLQDHDFRPPQVRLVAWSVASLSLSPPAGLPPLVDHFARLERYMDFTFEGFRLWRPPQQDVDRIRFCLEHGSPGDVQQALRQSLNESSRERITPRTPRPTNSLGQAYGDFHRLLGRPDSSKVQLRRAWQECQRAIQRELIGRLVQQATATDDPVTRTYCLAAAEVAQLVHAQSAALKVESMRPAEGSSGAALRPLSRDDVQTLLALTDRLLKLAKEIQRCDAQPIWRPGG